MNTSINTPQADWGDLPAAMEQKLNVALGLPGRHSWAFSRLHDHRYRRPELGNESHPVLTNGPIDASIVGITVSANATSPFDLLIHTFAIDHPALFLLGRGIKTL